MATRTAVQKRPQDEAKPEKSKPAAAERPKAATVDSHAKAAALMQDPHAVRDTPENVLEVAIGREVRAFRKKLGLTVADLSNEVRPVAVSLAHVAARQEMRNLMLALGLDGSALDAPLDAAA